MATGNSTNSKLNKQPLSTGVSHIHSRQRLRNTGSTGFGGVGEADHGLPTEAEMLELRSNDDFLQSAGFTNGAQQRPMGIGRRTHHKSLVQ